MLPVDNQVQEVNEERKSNRRVQIDFVVVSSRRFPLFGELED